MMRELVYAIFSDKFMIFLSAMVVPILLLPIAIGLPEPVLSFLDVLDWLVISLFIVEYLSKLYLAENRWQHFKSPWRILDLVIVVLPFVQIFALGLSSAGSYSLLLRLIRLPRALVLGGRAVAGRKSSNHIDSTLSVAEPQTIIRHVGSDLTTVNGNLTWKDVETHLTDTSSPEWIDIHNISSQGFAKLSEILHVSEPHFKSGLMDEIYPHIDYVQKASFIFLQSGVIKYPEHAGHYLTISRSGMIVICNGQKIITVSRHHYDMLEGVLQSFYHCGNGVSFTVPVLYGILEHILNDYKAILSEIELEVIKIGGTPRSKLPRDFLERIHQLDREVTRLVSNFVHFKDLLITIISKKVPLTGFDKSSEESFHVMQEAASYLNEIASDLTNNLQSIINLYINQTSFETNRILKVLAVITALALIPSALGGLVGMNLLDSPFDAYLWQVVSMVAIVMVFMGYIFYKLGWLKT
jgi:Mg2+ and Co2+ transporter CorA